MGAPPNAWSGFGVPAPSGVIAGVTGAPRTLWLRSGEPTPAAGTEGVAEATEGVLLHLGESVPATAFAADGDISEHGSGVCLILKPPIHLAACRRNQRGLLPGTTQSFRRWHSSQGHVPPSET